jgi:DNA-binding response OmpR family regulator
MKGDMPILLAEDDENDVFLMRRAFREAGLIHPLVVVGNGQEAISYLNGEGLYADRKQYPWPCLLLLDLKMPLVDGFEVLAWLQRRRRPTRLTVVILSSSMLEQDQLQALKLGADSYVVKPQDFTELVKVVRGLSGRINQIPAPPAWLEAPRYEARW